MPMYNNDTPKIIRDWLVLLGMIGGVIMWFSTMYGLPPRVSKLEEQVSNHESSLTENRVKIDIILGDVKDIKTDIKSIMRNMPREGK